MLLTTRASVIIWLSGVWIPNILHHFACVGFLSACMGVSSLYFQETSKTLRDLHTSFRGQSPPSNLSPLPKCIWKFLVCFKNPNGNPEFAFKSHIKVFGPPPLSENRGPPMLKKLFHVVFYFILQSPLTHSEGLKK